MIQETHSHPPHPRADTLVQKPPGKYNASHEIGGPGSEYTSR